MISQTFLPGRELEFFSCHFPMSRVTKKVTGGIGKGVSLWPQRI